MIRRIINLCLLLFFCSTLQANQPLQNFNFILDWFANPLHGPVLIAQAKGFFAAQGLNVNIIVPADPTDTAKMVAVGQADMGVGSDPELLLLINQGLPLLRAGALLDQPLAALTSYDVSELKNIKGKTIGYPVGGIDKILLSIMVQHVGLSLQDVNLVDVHYNLTQALLSKRVDAIAGAMRNYEVPQLKMAGMKVYTFYPENYGVPSYAELNYIINQAHQHDPRVPVFLQAVKLATQYIKQHPQQSWQLLIKMHPELNTPLNKLSWDMTYKLFANNPAANNQTRFMHLVRVMHKTGWLDHVQSFNHYAL